MSLSSLPASVVQIIYLTLNTNVDLNNAVTKSGRIWSQAVEAISSSEQYLSLRWGRSVEQPEKVQLHVTRTSLSAHTSYLASSSFQKFLDILKSILETSQKEVKVRHVESLINYTSTPTTPFHAPVTGTAIYLSTTLAWHKGSWPCWTHVVRHIKGCTGIAGGRVIEFVDTGNASSFAGVSAHNPDSDQIYQNCFVVYVGWETIQDHNNYHHTKHFRDHGVILSVGNEGWREYGHIRFEGWHGQESSSIAKL